MKKCTSFLHVNRIHFQLVLIVTCTFNLALALANCVTKQIRFSSLRGLLRNRFLEMSGNALSKESGELRDMPKNGCEGDYSLRGKRRAREHTRERELENMQALLFF